MSDRDDLVDGLRAAFPNGRLVRDGLPIGVWHVTDLREEEADGRRTETHLWRSDDGRMHAWDRVTSDKLLGDATCTRQCETDVSASRFGPTALNLMEDARPGWGVEPRTVPIGSILRITRVLRELCRAG